LSNTAIFVALFVGVAAGSPSRAADGEALGEREQKGDVGAITTSPARIGLWIFMAVVTSLFSLFLSAYSMRMHQSIGWCHLTIRRSSGSIRSC
jgi:heme/copper-type cytochrome/quinol oxidase subunit 3